MLSLIVLLPINWLNRCYHRFFVSRRALNRGLVFLMLVSIGSGAQAFCEHLLTAAGEVQVGRQYQEDSDLCYVSVQPRNIVNMVYRDYLISSSGLVMVFNSYGEGLNSDATGAREFYFFPRKEADLKIEMPENETDDLKVMMAAGRWISFSQTTGDISGLEAGRLRRDPLVKRTNRGGVDIRSYDGVYLDAGFTLGQSPTDSLTRTSVFRDANRRSCSLRNDLIFTKEGQNSVLKSDELISEILKTHCPKLQIEF